MSEDQGSWPPCGPVVGPLTAEVLGFVYPETPDTMPSVVVRASGVRRVLSVPAFIAEYGGKFMWDCKGVGVLVELTPDVVTMTRIRA